MYPHLDIAIKNQNEYCVNSFILILVFALLMELLWYTFPMK